LDVALGEDACKIHHGYAADNLSRVRHIALNYLKSETNFKDGIWRKKKKAALDENYFAAASRFSRYEMLHAFSLQYPT